MTEDEAITAALKLTRKGANVETMAKLQDLQPYIDADKFGDLLAAMISGPDGIDALREYDESQS